MPVCKQLSHLVHHHHHRFLIVPTRALTNPSHQALVDAVTDADPDTSTPRRLPAIAADASAPPNWQTAGQIPLSGLPTQAGGGALGTTSLLHFAYRHVATQQAVSSVVDDALGCVQQVCIFLFIINYAAIYMHQA